MKTCKTMVWNFCKTIMEKTLRRSAVFLRRELGKVLDLRYAPDLQFHYDDSYYRGAPIDEILRGIPGREEGPGEG